MNVSNENYNEKISLNKKIYSMGEIIEKVNRIGINSYHDLPEFEQISLIKKLDTLDIIPKEKEDNQLWMLTDKIIQKHFLGNGQAHNCYWNDSFYLTNRFGSKEIDKKKSAIVALWNGRNNYWEWQTHYGFDNKKLISRIISTEDYKDYNLKGYTSISKDLHNKLKDYFKLTNDDLKAARWICPTIYEKERKTKLEKNLV